ncbi:BRE1-domain-containing protein [Daedaleopsis nitida]|nr:BRE1-domain-containing protein [Daedaleopsis nitida]
MQGTALTKKDKHIAEFEYLRRPLVVDFLLELAVAGLALVHPPIFSAPAMESKKRPHVDDDEPSRAKKRAVSDDHASPMPSHPNGTSASHSDEPKEGDNIELFRKEAIYRRMKYYSREAERSQARAADLERRFHSCQAGLAALEACWSQLIGTIRSLVKAEDLPSLQKESEGESFSDIYDLSARVSRDASPDYVNALQTKMQSTSDLLKMFVTLSTQKESNPSQEHVLKQCHEAETERSALRSEVSLLRIQLDESVAQKEKFHDQLIAAEKRADRLQSKSLQTGSVITKEEPSESGSREPESSPAPPPVNGVHPVDAEEWRDLANLRETKIQELVRENTDLQNQLQTAQLQLKALPNELIIETLPYKALQERASKYEHIATETQGELSKVKDQLDQMSTARSELESGLNSLNEAEVSELKQLVSKRDAEISRLREQRDQLQVEITERKAREQQRYSAAAEFKALAEARAERIAIFEAENKRLKTRLAAKAGNEDLVQFLWQSTSTEASYVDDLKHRLSTAEGRVAALEKTLESVEGDRGDIAKNEAELRRQLVQVQKELEKYHATESALFDELDRLTSAWETLEKQVKKKVYDLSALEDRISKLNTERAKAENKFFQCVRDKEAVDAERRKLAVNLEKAAKAIETLTDTEKNMTNRLHTVEREAMIFRKLSESHRNRGELLDTELAEWRMRAESEKKTVEEFRAAFAEHTLSIERKRTELRKLEESLLKTKKDAEKHASKLKSVAGSSGSTKEAELQKEVNNCMTLLKCSTCQINWRNTVITKCMHTFCKQCVEARIATRQRKCPACNLPFSQGEVQTLYLQ